MAKGLSDQYFLVDNAHLIIEVIDPRLSCWDLEGRKKADVIGRSLNGGNNVDELVDVVSEQNEVLESKLKSLVHRDGDWHRSVHLWIVDPLSKKILLQRRSPNKDTDANMLDVAVGGHVASGEKYSEAWREIKEELGVEIGISDILELGVIPVAKRQAVLESQEGLSPLGILTRELCLVAITSKWSPACQYSFDPEELSGVVEVSLTGLRDLLADIPAQGMSWDGMSYNPIDISPDELVRQPYLAEFLGLCESFMAGKQDIRFTASLINSQ